MSTCLQACKMIPAKTSRTSQSLEQKYMVYKWFLVFSKRLISFLSLRLGKKINFEFPFCHEYTQTDLILQVLLDPG